MFEWQAEIVERNSNTNTNSIKFIPYSELCQSYVREVRTNKSCAIIAFLRSFPWRV